MNFFKKLFSKKKQVEENTKCSEWEIKTKKGKLITVTKFVCISEDGFIDDSRNISN